MSETPPVIPWKFVVEVPGEEPRVVDGVRFGPKVYSVILASPAPEGTRIYPQPAAESDRTP